MNIAKRIYAALVEECPDVKSDRQLADVTGSKSIGKLKSGRGIGIKEAKWLVKRNPKWQPLLEDARNATEKVRLEHGKNLLQGFKKRHMGLVNPAILPPAAQVFCGYIGE